MRHIMQTRAVLASLCCVVALSLSACGPAVQRTTGSSSNLPTNPAKSGKLVPSSTWLTLEASAQAGTQLQYYMEQITANMSQGSLHSDYSVYGTINPPDRAAIGIHEGNTNTYYYQQGKVAYYQDNGRWSLTDTLGNLDLFSSFANLISNASQAGVTLYQQKKAYVVDEYCDVYTSVLPAGMLSPLPSFSGTAAEPMGAVAVTWYVGRTDHVLRRVDMQSVGSVTDIGQMQVNTSVLLFDINSPYAKVTIPKNLEQQLENLTG